MFPGPGFKIKPFVVLSKQNFIKFCFMECPWNARGMPMQQRTLTLRMAPLFIFASDEESLTLKVQKHIIYNTKHAFQKD